MAERAATRRRAGPVWAVRFASEAARASVHAQLDALVGVGPDAPIPYRVAAPAKGGRRGR